MSTTARFFYWLGIALGAIATYWVRPMAIVCIAVASFAAWWVGGIVWERLSRRGR